MIMHQRSMSTFALFCFSLLFVSHASFAGDSLKESLRVKDEETQLAKRFAERESAEPPFEYSLSAVRGVAGWGGSLRGIGPDGVD